MLINTIYQRVNRDLAKKDMAGYSDNEEFNRNFHDAQGVLVEYYWAQKQTDKAIDALNPFIKQVDINISSGFVVFPEDYRHTLDLGYNYIISNCEGNIVNIIPMRFTHNEQQLIASTIRKPNLSKGRVAYCLVDNKIKTIPKDLTGTVNLKYLSNPIEAIRVVDINTAEDTEDFNEVDSINPLWRDAEEQNLIDLMLFFKGLQIRESAIVDWLQVKQQMK